jgi:hypothetical protein
VKRAPRHFEPVFAGAQLNDARAEVGLDGAQNRGQHEKSAKDRRKSA